MDGLKQIWAALWKNKPLLITIAVALGILVFIFWRSVVAPNNASEGMQVMGDGTMASGGGAPTTGVEKTIQAIFNITPVPGGKPPGITIPTIPTIPTPAIPSGTPQQAAAVARKAVVTPWPSQNSTLFGIAQKEYGNGNLWTKIYEANKNQIKNPNLVYAGQELVIP